MTLWRTWLRGLLASLALVVLPVAWLVPAIGSDKAGPRIFGRGGTDAVSHMWAMWNATQGPLTSTRFNSWPEQVDLLPILPGWADVAIGGALTRAVGLVVAYDVVMGLYVVLAGAGAYALARVAGASVGASVLAGLLLQLDGYVLDHLREGRPEQVGLGVVPLVLAGALHMWRTPSTRPAAVATGIAAAAAVFVSWELAVTTALIGGWLLPWLWAEPRAPSAPRRFALAGLVAAVLTGPWVVWFLLRAGAARPLDESGFSLPLAGMMSEPLLGWFLPGSIRPSWAVLAALPLAAVFARRGRGRLWLGIGLGLVLASLLGTGPSPRLFGPAASEPTAWAPFLLLQKLPLMGWYHWPDRPLLVWSVAAPVAAALLVDAARRRLKGLPGLAAAGLLAAGFLAGAAWEDLQTARWPEARYAPPRSPALRWLAEDPRPGAVLDLPRRGPGNLSVDYTAAQLVHGRPIRFGLLPDRLTGVDQQAFIDQIPLLAWLERSEWGADGPPPPLTEADVEWLGRQGFGWLNVRMPGVPPDVAYPLISEVESRLGEPVRHEAPFFQFYRIPAPPEDDPTR